MKAKTIFYCTQCGNETPKWQGQCSACGAWNTIVEQPAPAKGKSGGNPALSTGPIRKPKRVSEMVIDQEIRFPTGLAELDRVLGGGAVQGSLVLIGGAPGIGKSTLMLQICHQLCQFAKVLYVSGEESERQLKLRAERLGVGEMGLYLFAENDLEQVSAAVEETAPDILIVDSIQTMYTGDQSTSPGSISQVKECTMALMQLAKGRGITVFVIGHVNKEGNLAGPKVLEHMVDCVLYFEGDRHMSYRILRAAKNRYGATNEIGVFEMKEQGLVEVENPSKVMLDGRPTDASGSVVVCSMEGTRPLLIEIQALVSPTSFNMPRRTTVGIDFNRVNLLLAVLEKKAGMQLGGCDAYVNLAGGMKLGEPAIDLGIICAVVSSYRNLPVHEGTLIFGEVGLTGEVRGVSHVEQRLAEAIKMGFTRCIMPKTNAEVLGDNICQKIQVIGVSNVREVIQVL